MPRGISQHLFIPLQTSNPGDFVDRAHEAIDDILSRGKVPVVVGGTMMYIHWLVHGRPDAPKKVSPGVSHALFV